jgi:hypothetical protein
MKTWTSLVPSSFFLVSVERLIGLQCPRPQRKTGRARAGTRTNFEEGLINTPPFSQRWPKAEVASGPVNRQRRSLGSMLGERCRLLSPGARGRESGGVPRAPKSQDYLRWGHLVFRIWLSVDLADHVALKHTTQELESYQTGADSAETSLKKENAPVQSGSASMAPCLRLRSFRAQPSNINSIQTQGQNQTKGDPARNDENLSRISALQDSRVGKVHARTNASPAPLAGICPMSSPETQNPQSGPPTPSSQALRYEVGKSGSALASLPHASL